MKIILSDNVVSTDLNKVKEHWRSEFSLLYNNDNENNNLNRGFDQSFYEEATSVKEDMEREALNIVNGGNEFINSNIEYHEVEHVIDKLKSKKSVGIDGIPNEVLKQPSVKIIL